MLAFSELDGLCNVLKVSEDILEETKKIFRELFLSKKTRTISHLGVLSACIFVCCRKHGNMVPLKDILSLNKITKPTFVKCYLVLKRHLKSKETEYIKDEKYNIKGIFEKLEFSVEMMSIYKFIYEKIKEMNLDEGFDDNLVSIVIVLIVYNLFYVVKISPMDISTLSKIEETIIKAYYRSLYKNRFKILSDIAESWVIGSIVNF